MAGEERIFGGQPVLEFSTSTDRRRFLKMAGLVGVGATFVAGGLLGGAGVAGASPATIMHGAAPAAGTEGDVEILNYALTLEYLEADFYAQGIQKGLLKDRELELVTPIGDHEKTHVSAVTDAVKAFGGTPVSKPKITYPSGTFASRDSFLKTASMFEELGVTAYHGQVPLIKSADVLSSAAAIAGSESRHAAVIAALIGGQPFPRPVEAHADMATVLAAVKPLIS